MVIYLFEFNLGVDSIFQYIILVINPIATTVFIFSIFLYIRKPKTAYITLMALFLILSIWLFSNVIYYREFTDFITINTILGSGKVASGLGESAIRLFRPYDFIYFVDFIVLVVLLATKKIKEQEKPVRARYAFAVTTFSILMFSINLTLAETDRPELLTRTFSRDYIVKYLGLNVFNVYDGVLTYKTNQVRAQASENDLVDVEDYVNSHYAAPDNVTFGKAEGKNIIYIHLESMQQFLIDFKVTDENGVEHEVTPFLNSLYHSNSTYSFDNFFHQVKAGKTSDAETLLENSFFGLNQGALFTQLGDKNTFEAASDILGQTKGYTSAVFHGNAGSFWNRNETYKSFGYDYFFDSSYYDLDETNSFQYGLHDKPFFEQSIQYLEHLQQPFYTKMLAVSNHYPFSKFTDDNSGFPIMDTGDATINGYFATANYSDKAIEEFFNYLKSSGLYENSMIVLYGDHNGISNSRNPNLAELLGKTKDTWTDLDNIEMQRVPFMIHIPGQTDGSISHVYGGEVDILPTVLHLAGVDTSKYMQLGQDMLSPEHEQIVATRDGNVISDKYYTSGSTIYDAVNKVKIENPSEEVLAEVQELKDKVRLQLKTSDALVNGDLLRFYTESGLQPIDRSQYNYTNQLEKMIAIEQEKGDESTSVYSQNNNQSTVGLYSTKTYKEYQGEQTTTSSTTSSSAATE